MGTPYPTIVLRRASGHADSRLEWMREPNQETDLGDGHIVVLPARRSVCNGCRLPQARIRVGLFVGLDERGYKWRYCYPAFDELVSRGEL
jgi:hypothetical protein